jgi:O-antigen/teichoic acid export membrane protein
MPDDVAPSNVNRSYSLAGLSITIFTFSLTFLYPRFASGDINGDINVLLFQTALAVMGIATFSFVIASMYYYGASLAGVIADAQRADFSKYGDRLWLLGFTLLYLTPSLILFAVGLIIVGAVWLILWAGYLAFARVHFPRTRAPRKAPDAPQSL